MRTNKRIKQLKIDQVLQWCTEFNKSNHGQYTYTIEKLLKNDIEVLTTLMSMSTKQLQLTLSLISNGYGHGCAQTRKWFKKHNEVKNENA